jgi:hypothetical protein
MGSYLLLYHGGAAPTSPAEGEQVMKAWVGWFTTLGDKVEHAGNPTSTTQTVAADGSVSDATSGVTGFSVLKADSWAGAIALAESCPHRAAGGTIEVVQVDAM